MRMRKEKVSAEAAETRRSVDNQRIVAPTQRLKAVECVREELEASVSDEKVPTKEGLHQSGDAQLFTPHKHYIRIHNSCYYSVRT